MGFLDRLRGTDDITISVRLEPPEVQPGGTVTIHFDVGGELDDKCRGIRVGVRGRARYLVEERDRDSSGHVDVDQVWRDYELHSEEHHYPAQPGPGKASLTLPVDAPPASADAVEWEAFARVDRERGMDKTESVPLPVRLPASALPTARAPQTADDGLTLEEVPVAVREGEQLTGHLTVHLADDTKVTAARIRLHRRCTYTAERVDSYDLFQGNLLGGALFGGGRATITRDAKVAELDLSGKREFAAGATERIAFAIDVPAGSGPTTAHAHAGVEWRVEAVLDRRMRDDLAVELPVAVY